MKIITVKKSPRAKKRYRVEMDDGSYYDFGLLGGSTYIDHKDVKIREAYRARHLGNPREKWLIENLIPSPALFAYYLLWGRYPDLKKCVTHLNGLFAKNRAN